MLGLVAVIAVVGYAISSFSTKTGRSDTPQDPSVKNNSDQSAGGSPEDAISPETGMVPTVFEKDAAGRTVVTGVVTQVLTRKSEEGSAWVTVSVSADDGSMKDFKFFFAKDAQGEAVALSGGETVSIHFQGEPSETDAVVAEEVEKK